MRKLYDALFAPLFVSQGVDRVQERGLGCALGNGEVRRVQQAMGPAPNREISSRWEATTERRSVEERCRPAVKQKTNEIARLSPEPSDSRRVE